jgi:PPOX class probable F420-dependent enzyme
MLMTALTAAARTVLDGPALAHLVTVNPDGSPQASVVWAGVDGDEVVTAHLGEYQKIRNVRSDPRVVLTVESGTTNAAGLPEYLIIRGRARVTDGGAPALLQHLAQTYIGPGATYPPMPDPPPGFVLRISVDRVSGVGPWNDAGH